METVVDQLQTQRQELLAAHAATSDRETTRSTIEQLKHLSQELELVASAATSSPHAAVLSAEFYASYLVLVLLCRDLNDARFLWKRIPLAMKEASEELQHVWEIGKALWQRNLAAAYDAMDYDWSPSLQGLIEDLKNCMSLNWSVSEADHMISPKPLRSRPSMAVDLAQLDTLSEAVLHLEQNTVMKLP
ncbi:hypothetical protein PsorP6_013137 [Peronosclerospora sorghi]|uniref:Uncharacterized protein n=1 Tax=Peronosclerospora sorghi TaxID=230839 RepID=A0ACC0WFQ9_9STRA|nr:hypothetical protein PsorP6_013137 [Peronosclerospora sorghi]